MGRILWLYILANSSDYKEQKLRVSKKILCNRNTRLAKQNHKKKKKVEGGKKLKRKLYFNKIMVQLSVHHFFYDYSSTQLIH